VLILRRTVILAALLSSYGIGQSVTDSSAGLSPSELALRERAVQFFQFHIDGKYRLAYDLVALDSRARFYSAQKPRLLSFKITRVEFSKSDPTQALVVIESQQKIVPPDGRAFVAERVPITTWWRFEDGDWKWYREVGQPAKHPVLQP
jgi:hypothetical protein